MKELIATVYRFQDKKFGVVEFHRLDSCLYDNAKWIVRNPESNHCLTKSFVWELETARFHSGSNFENCLFDSLELAVQGYENSLKVV